MGAWGSGFPAAETAVAVAGVMPLKQLTHTRTGDLEMCGINFLNDEHEPQQIVPQLRQWCCVAFVH